MSTYAKLPMTVSKMDTLAQLLGLSKLLRTRLVLKT